MKKFAALESGGFAGINIMRALVRDYDDSVKGALDANADAIISGAGAYFTAYNSTAKGYCAYSNRVICKSP